MTDKTLAGVLVALIVIAAAVNELPDALRCGVLVAVTVAGALAFVVRARRQPVVPRERD